MPRGEDVIGGVDRALDELEPRGHWWRNVRINIGARNNGPTMESNSTRWKKSLLIPARGGTPTMTLVNVRVPRIFVPKTLVTINTGVHGAPTGWSAAIRPAPGQ